MSYDLVVFDPDRAPEDASDFLEWYRGQSEGADEVSECSSPRLRSFFVDMMGRFPAMSGPHAEGGGDDPKLTDYAFGPASIYMEFAWSQAAEARRTVIELARKNSVGFYDLGDPQGSVWRPPKADELGVFYFFGETQEEVTSELPRALKPKEIARELAPRMVSDADFLGIVDRNGATLQFMYERARDRVWMEIPVPERRGSYGTYLWPGELRARIESLPEAFSLSAFSGLRFQSWDPPKTRRGWWKFWK